MLWWCDFGTGSDRPNVRPIRQLPTSGVHRAPFRAVNALPSVAPSWDIAPSQDAMVVDRHPETDECHLDLMRWGHVPHWTKDRPKTKHPINAHAETAPRPGYSAHAVSRFMQQHKRWSRVNDGLSQINLGNFVQNQLQFVSAFRAARHWSTSITAARLAKDVFEGRGLA
jgi:hypothetical protein